MSLYKWMKDNGVEPEDLDELVHEAANDMAEIMASNVNNEGLNSQVAFLNTSGWNDDDIKDELLRLKRREP